MVKFKKAGTIFVVLLLVGYLIYSFKSEGPLLLASISGHPHAIYGAHRLTTKQEEELKSYLPAAERGDADAQLKVGDLYVAQYGIAILDCAPGDLGCAKGVQEARNLMLAEVTGDSYVPGYSYIRGNDAEAVKWWWKAADQRNVEAQDRIRDFYRIQKLYVSNAAKGDIASKNRIISDVPSWREFNSASIRWYRETGGKGDAQSLYLMGSVYFTGTGVTQDFQEAYFWYSLAAISDGQYSSSRDEAAAKLTTEQLENVKKRVAELKPEPAH